MGRLFGTDGARGIAITELTCERAMQIGRAAALVLTKNKKTEGKAKIFIGKDTRISSDVLEAALCAGICSVGADAVQLGVIPTPAVAYLVRTKGADAGVMISASHNSVEFNGIKLFAGTGYKLPDAIEQEIEHLILDCPEEITLQSGIAIGAVKQYATAKEDYISYLSTCIQGDLSGMKVALDCANGSSAATAEKLFTGLGAEVFMLSATPDGTNINKNCGSTHMEDLMAFVKSHDVDLGLAFDGDADRCLAVDENGEMIDGDRIIAICAKAMQEKGTLKKNTAVMTVMTNLGFFHFAKRQGMNVIATKVGDRYVLEEMLKSDYAIGGEQSGHIIFLGQATTGDGELSGIRLMEVLRDSGKKMSELASVMECYPQILLNVTVDQAHRGCWEQDEDIQAEIQKYTEKLGENGRILVRESGTEPLVRVMVEGKVQEEILEAANAITEKVKQFAAK